VRRSVWEGKCSISCWHWGCRHGVGRVVCVRDRPAGAESACSALGSPESLLTRAKVVLSGTFFNALSVGGFRRAVSSNGHNAGFQLPTVVVVTVSWKGTAWALPCCPNGWWRQGSRVVRRHSSARRQANGTAKVCTGEGGGRFQWKAGSHMVGKENNGTVEGRRVQAKAGGSAMAVGRCVLRLVVFFLWCVRARQVFPPPPPASVQCTLHAAVAGRR